MGYLSTLNTEEYEMRVCDITKSEQVEARFVLLEVPLDLDAELLLHDRDGDSNKARIVKDYEVGSSAAAALNGGVWRTLHQLTPPAERPKDASRSEAAKKAGETRRANKATKAEAAANVTSEA